MTPSADLPLVTTVLQICLVDLLLSGDNAVVVALASRGLSGRRRRAAVTLGIAIAILLRIALASGASIALHLPGLKLVGGVVLVVIAARLATSNEPVRPPGGGPAAGAGRSGLAGAVAVIAVADLVMSFDNVVAIAAIARGNIVLLALGLLLSIPFLIWGTAVLIALLRRYRPLVIAGGALLGWIAGGIAVTDPVVADWIDREAPALPYAVPAFAALFVLAETRWARKPQPAGGSAPHRPVAPADGPATAGSPRC
jgi:YjbE family integral membrane protein